jgi:hypothetical protein
MTLSNCCTWGPVPKSLSLYLQIDVTYQKSHAPRSMPGGWHLGTPFQRGFSGASADTGIIMTTPREL